MPTFSFRLEGKTPLEVAKALAAENIYVWDGNYYALAVTERLGVEDSGGMVRAGAVHYNTLDEIAHPWGCIEEDLTALSGTPSKSLFEMASRRNAVFWTGLKSRTYFLTP